MNEAHEPDQAGEWLTVAQAAAALGVSARAVQKRCASGKIAARRVTTPQGAKWEIDANPLGRTSEPAREHGARTSEHGTRTSEPAREHGARTSEPAREHGTRTSEPSEHEPANEPANESDANQRTDADSYAARLIEAQAAEILFLRAQIEAANLNAARWAQEARDMRQLYAKALMPATEDSVPAIAQEAQNGAQNSGTTATSPEPIIEAQRPAEPLSGVQIGAHDAEPERRKPESASEIEPAAAQKMAADEDEAKSWYPPPRPDTAWTRAKRWLIGG